MSLQAKSSLYSTGCQRRQIHGKGRRIGPMMRKYRAFLEGYAVEGYAKTHAAAMKYLRRQHIAK